MKLTLIILFTILTQITLAQSNSDFEKIAEHFDDQSSEKIYANNKNQKFYIKYNPVYHVLKTGLRLYKINISPQLATTCIYEQSCSRFSNAVIEEYGLVKGFFLTCDRLSRCNKMSYTDYDILSKNRFGKVQDHLHHYSFKHD